MPLDAGTRKVLEDGYQILVDKQGVLTNEKFSVRPLDGQYSDS